jgi:hypothetical protein
LIDPDLIDTVGYVDADERWSTHNYHPLPVVISYGEGTWVTDVAGKRYLDFLAGYSALNFGHRHPALVAAAIAQLGRVTRTRAVGWCPHLRRWAHRTHGGGGVDGPRCAVQGSPLHHLADRSPTSDHPA